MININLEGKTALVTGASRGIGRAIAMRLAEAGANIVGVDVLEEPLVQTMADCEAMGVKTYAGVCNICDMDAVAGLVSGVMKQFGQIDILVNNAGITRDNLVIRMSDEEWKSVMDVNLTGCFHLCKAVGRPMLKAKSGKIINITSISGHIGNPGQSNYSASKSGMIGFTKSIAREFATKGITANCVAPGVIKTEMSEQLNDAQKERLFNMIPLKQIGSPRNISDAVLFLAGDLSNYITGQVLNVDGGIVM
jgi:3-oxoacyl-[acyl-carrier protein] reductase